MKPISSIEFNLDSVSSGLRLFVDSRKVNSMFDAEETLADNNEARYQLLEGCYYDYAFNNDQYFLGDIGEQIVLPHSRNKHTGTLAPNIFVGTLSLPILQKGNEHEVANVELEVQSVKSGYRDDYRDMLEFITEKSTDLLLQANSPVSHYFELDYSKDSQTLYQKFAFIKSIIQSDEFVEAIHKIVSSPDTQWTEKEEFGDVRRLKRFSNAVIKQIAKGGNRTALLPDHSLRNIGINSLPDKLSCLQKADSIDTPENRFIKHALEVFLKFCTDINKVAAENSKLKRESFGLIRQLESQLHHTIFSEITKPSTLKLNSPVLQRKEGYREILRVWLMFDLAAKLIWSGGDDIYKGGKKDIATLYEYWLFFQLLDLLGSIFQLRSNDISDLLKETPDGLNLQLKQGKFIALQGTYDAGSRKLNIRFSYNRSFSGQKYYPAPGSWTATLRPDYTLSFWPSDITEEQAEKEELIVHIHFDAKYKVANLTEFIDSNSDVDLQNQKLENRKGVYKNADLLKMHAYKDAIRRTAGAYILYPGERFINRRGFHEIIPGLGAFPVRPSKIDTGITELKAFILQVIEHFVNRTTQREKIAFQNFRIYQQPPDEASSLRERLPEAYGANRSMLPDETYVLIGYYKSAEHYEWIKKHKLYNFRMGSGNGSLTLDLETVTAKYLLLHTKGDSSSGNLWRIVSKGPKVYSKNDMIGKGYSQLTQENYLVIEIMPVSDMEFKDVKWDFRKLKKYITGRASAFPFCASLLELTKNRVR